MRRQNGLEKRKSGRQIQSAISRTRCCGTLCPERSGNAVWTIDSGTRSTFDPWLIEWRVTNTTKSGKLRGQVIPYVNRVVNADKIVDAGPGHNEATGKLARA